MLMELAFAGNLGEQAIARVIGGKVMGGNQRGYGLLLNGREKVQVKSQIRPNYRQNSQFIKGV